MAKDKRPQYYITDKLKTDLVKAKEVLYHCRDYSLIPEETRKFVLDTIEKAHVINFGIIRDTANLLDIEPNLWRKWRNEIAGFAEMESSVNEHFINFAEGQLSKNIKSGKELSLIFYLKNKAPDVWKDRQAVQITNNWADLVQAVDASKQLKNITPSRSVLSLDTPDSYEEIKEKTSESVYSNVSSETPPCVVSSQQAEAGGVK